MTGFGRAARRDRSVLLQASRTVPLVFVQIVCVHQYFGK